MATKSVDFGTLVAPDLAAEQLRLQRQQQIADYLRQQSMAPIEQQTVSGAGPTRVVPISPLQGLAKMLTAYMGSKNQDSIDSKTLDINKQMAQRYAQILGGATGTSTAQQPGDYGQPATTPSPGGPLGSGTYGIETGGQPAASAPAGAPAGGSNAFGLANILRGAAVQQIGGDPAAAAYWDQQKLTDASRMANQAGMDPRAANAAALLKANTAPGVLEQQQSGMNPEQIKQAALSLAAKNGEIERRGGNQFQNFFTGQSGIVPKIPEYSNPVGSIAPNGAIPGGVSQMPGALPIASANAQAAAGGSASGAFHDVTLSSGAKVPVRGAEIGPGGSLQPPDADRKTIYQGEERAATQRLAQLKAMPNVDPQMLGRAQADLDGVQREMKRYNIPLGQSTADKTTQEANAKMMVELPAQVQQTKQTITGLENAYKTIEAVGKSGPGVSKTVDAMAVLNNLGIPVMKGDTNGYQTLKKYLENQASTAAASNGFTGSDARFEQFKAGQPNAETMNPDALKGAIRYVLSQHDASIARAQFIQQAAQQNGNDPNAVQKAAQQFSQVYNPRVFEFSRMTPQDRQAAVKAMSPQQLQQFRQQYGQANQAGWVQ